MSRPPSPAVPSAPVFSDTDRDMMRRALTLAAEGRFSTSPNPRVGCIIAHGGQIVGQGFHLKAGGPHAEVHALRQAGEHARGATAYVTLEPCSHYGRTPPCAEALIQAGVSRVVAAIADPNPQVAGKGLAMLSAAGIRTESGLLETEARELNRGFLSRIERGRPFVRLKCAASLDGKTALSDGLSQWITGEAARHDVQILRAESCAVLTGIGTVLADDPQLNVPARKIPRRPRRRPASRHPDRPRRRRPHQPARRPPPAGGTRHRRTPGRSRRNAVRRIPAGRLGGRNRPLPSGQNLRRQRPQPVRPARKPRRTATTRIMANPFRNNPRGRRPQTSAAQKRGRLKTDFAPFRRPFVP